MMLHSVEKDQRSRTERKLPTALVKRSIATVFAALLASVVAPSAWGPVNAQVITNYPFRDSFARHYHVEEVTAHRDQGGHQWSRHHLLRANRNGGH